MEEGRKVILCTRKYDSKLDNKYYEGVVATILQVIKAQNPHYLIEILPHPGDRNPAVLCVDFYEVHPTHETIATLSTAHIQQNDDAIIMRQINSQELANYPLGCILSKEGGYAIHVESFIENFVDGFGVGDATKDICVPIMKATGHSEAFCNLLSWAHNGKIDWLRFDALAPQRNDLSTFDWQ